MIQPIYFDRSNFIYVQIPENKNDTLLSVDMYVDSYSKIKIVLTIPKSQQEYFLVSRQASLSYSGLRFQCTCISEDNSCHQDNPDRCHLQFNNDRRKINELSVFPLQVSRRKHLVYGRLKDLWKQFHGQFAKPEFDKLPINSV